MSSIFSNEPLTKEALDTLLHRYGDPSKLRELLSRLSPEDFDAVVSEFRSHDEFIRRVYGDTDEEVPYGRK